MLSLVSPYPLETGHLWDPLLVPNSHLYILAGSSAHHYNVQCLRALPQFLVQESPTTTMALRQAYRWHLPPGSSPEASSSVVSSAITQLQA